MQTRALPAAFAFSHKRRPGKQKGAGSHFVCAGTPTRLPSNSKEHAPPTAACLGVVPEVVFEVKFHIQCGHMLVFFKNFIQPVCIV
jgi:hypothetical protein